LDKLRTDDFDETIERGHQLLWSIASDFYRTYHQVPPIGAIYADILFRTSNHPDWDRESINGLNAMVQQYFEKPKDDKDLIPQYALSILQQWLYERRIHTRIMDYSEKYQTATPANGDIVQSLSDEFKQTRISSAEVIDPFAEDTNMLGVAPRERTGISFLDLLLGGGTRAGELYGFIAPSGGGKTTFGHQLCVTCARDRRKHIVVFSYEESPKTHEYMIPVYAMASGLSKTIFDDLNPWEKMKPDQRESYLKAKQDLATYVHYVDMSASDSSAGSGGPPEIDSVLIDMESRGMQVHGVIIDWLWPMFQRYFAGYKVARNKIFDERNFAQNLMDELKQVARRRKCWVWINHQAAPAKASKKSELSWTDAAEFRSFAWLVNVCFALGMLDNECLGQLNCAKNRGYKTSSQWVRLEGEYSRFVPVSGDYSWSRGKKRYESSEEMNRVPDTDRGDEVSSETEAYIGSPVDL
jgi:hypothetical protein